MSALEIMSPMELTGCVSSSLVTAETLFFLLLWLKSFVFGLWLWLQIEDLHLVVGVGGQTAEGIIQEANGFSLVLRRPLCDIWHQVLAADLSIKVVFFLCFVL
jgi:hypothetical protein